MYFVFGAQEGFAVSNVQFRIYLQLSYHNVASKLPCDLLILPILVRAIALAMEMDTGHVANARAV